MTSRHPPVREAESGRATAPLGPVPAPSILLPWPPSTNRLFANRQRGRAKTRAYDNWIYEAGCELLRQRPERHEGEVSVEITACPPNARKRDLDNLLKPCLDLLVRHQIIQDDSIRFLKSLNISLAEEEEFSGLRITITPLEAA